LPFKNEVHELILLCLGTNKDCIPMMRTLFDLGYGKQGSQMK
jgi:hypothetical protein